jgi:tRNA threonylcarbamoyl adenosine modification protein (Sua5/YciO/YrdC/YwlC family)
MAELITLNPYHPDPRLVAEASMKIRDGAIVVVPTDTVYALACSLNRKDGVKRLHRLKGVTAEDVKKPLSVLFHDLSSVATCTTGIPTSVYRTMKRVLPGPYTFVLNAPRRLSVDALRGRATLGCRIPDHPITLQILEHMGIPMLATSVKHVDERQPLDDPIDIAREMGDVVDLVIDVGPIFPEPSTVLDATNGYLEVIREGKGPLDAL